MHQRCADLAALGCAVLAPQLFARLDPPVVAIDHDEDFDWWLAEGMELTQALPWERAEADAIVALGALRAHGAVDESRVGLARSEERRVGKERRARGGRDGRRVRRAKGRGEGGAGGVLRPCPGLFFFQAEDGIRDGHVTGVQTCALPISTRTSTGGWRKGWS